MPKLSKSRNLEQSIPSLVFSYLSYLYSFLQSPKSLSTVLPSTESVSYTHLHHNNPRLPSSSVSATKTSRGCDLAQRHPSTVHEVYRSDVPYGEMVAPVSRRMTARIRVTKAAAPATSCLLYTSYPAKGECLYAATILGIRERRGFCQ